MEVAIPTVGDIVAIPTQAGAHVRALVLFRSKHFRNVVLLGTPPPENDTEEIGLSALVALLQLLVYSSRASIEAGRWPVVARCRLLESLPLTERIVADNIWLGDRVVREASDYDRRNTPVMRVAGEGAVELVLQEIALKSSLSKATAVLLRESEAFLARLKGDLGVRVREGP